MRPPEATPNMHPTTAQIWPQTTGGNQSYTYTWMVTSFSRGGTDPFACFQYGAEPRCCEQTVKETTAFLQPAVFLPFSCPGRTELSLVNLMWERDPVQHWDSCHLLSNAEGN